MQLHQIRKNYHTVINNVHSLEEVRDLTKIILTDFKKRYHPADGTGKLQYSSVASVRFGNRYVLVHHHPPPRILGSPNQITAEKYDDVCQLWKVEK
jgi:hypothetical protein